MFIPVHTRKGRHVKHSNIEVIRRYALLYKRVYPKKFVTILELPNCYALLEVW